MDWIVENWAEILALLGALGAVATIVCRMTPSPKDDELVAKILSWLHMLPGGKK